MRFSIAATSVAASLLALSSTTLAKVSSISAPSGTITSGQLFNVTFTAEQYIENYDQYYVAFGLTKDTNIGNSIGSATVATADISKYTSASYRTYNVPISITEGGFGGSPSTLACAIFGQVGASGEIWVQYFNTTINYDGGSDSRK